MAPTTRHRVTAMQHRVTAPGRTMAMTVRDPHGPTIPNAAARARASAPAAAWASARSAKARLRISTPADLIGNPAAVGRVSAHWRSVRFDHGPARLAHREAEVIAGSPREALALMGAARR